MGSIAGKVTDSTETAAIAGATVSVDSGQSATTAADGTYRISDVPTGARAVTASAAGHESQTSTATVNENSETTVDFSLAEVSVTIMVLRETSFRAQENKKGKVTSLVLEVTVTESDGITPVPSAVVSVAITRPDGAVFTGTSLTNSAGKVGFSPAGKLKTGRWTGSVTDATKDNHALDAGSSDLDDEIDI